jgi:hypothetical protein
MLKDSFKAIFRRDLEKLSQEITQYNNEAKIWYTEKAIPNSAGNLVLHLVGNLHTHVGLHLGNTGYVRHRELEFSQKDVPRAGLLQKIADTITMVETSLDKVTPAQLEAIYPIEMFGGPIITQHLLISLCAHLGYHLGQVNYHRRLLDS